MLSGKLQTGASATSAWDLSNVIYQGSPINWFEYSRSSGSVRGVANFFSPDGLNMYIITRYNPGSPFLSRVHRYNLSVAWDISTATSQSYMNITIGASASVVAEGIFFKPDGLKMYIVCRYSGQSLVFEYNLSTAWDISTAGYLQNFDVTNPWPNISETSPTGVFFKPDGSRMIVIGYDDDKVYSYDLSTPWDISTASYNYQNFYVGATVAIATGVFFKPDGSKMYVSDLAGQQDITEYDLSTAWDVSTAVLLQSFSTASRNNRLQGVFFKPDGLAVYVIGDLGDNTVNKFDLSVGWDISTASFIYPTTDFFSVAAQDTVPRGLFLKPDGLKMYVIGDAGNDVNEYDLSTAWDISTASYLQNFSVAAQTSLPFGLFLKPDGLKMYVLGAVGDAVYEYDLSVAWDISTAVYQHAFSVYAQDPLPYGLFLKPDGLKMYVVGITNGNVYEYDLSVAWDISTASYLQSFYVATQDTSPTDVFFKPDGLKMYVVGLLHDAVYEYDLSVAWDISTAVYQQGFSVYAQEASPYGLFFKPNGLVMYVVGASTDAVLSYDFV